MIIYTSSVEVVVYVLRRFPEINSPEALRRMVQAMMDQSQNFHGLAKQVVAHAGNRAGVETTWPKQSSPVQVRFYMPPHPHDENLKTAWMVMLEVKTKIDPEGTETYDFIVKIRHNNPHRDVRVLAAALLAEDEQKCTTTIGGDEGTLIHNLTYALQRALAKL